MRRTTYLIDRVQSKVSSCIWEVFQIFAQYPPLNLAKPRTTAAPVLY